MPRLQKPRLTRVTLSLPSRLAEQLSHASASHNVSMSALAEVLMLHALEQLPGPQLRAQLDIRGASLRRSRKP